MRRRQHLGWIFRAERAGPTRWVSGRSERARRRAGGMLERTLGCGGLLRRRQRGGELPWVDGSACASDAAVITLRSLISPPLSVSYTFTTVCSCVF